MSNPNSLVPFKKGTDPRRNVKGRVKSQDKLREKILAKLNKQATAQGKPLEIDGEAVTNLDVVLDQWMKNPKLQALLIEYGYGKVPQIVKGDGDDGEIVVRLIKDA